MAQFECVHMSVNIKPGFRPLSRQTHTAEMCEPRIRGEGEGEEQEVDERGTQDGTIKLVIGRAGVSNNCHETRC